MNPIWSFARAGLDDAARAAVETDLEGVTHLDQLEQILDGVESS